MLKFFTHQGLGALCFVLLVFSLSSEALAQHGANQVLTQRDLSSFRRIAEELWPFVAGPPSTPMGEAEAAWLATK